LVVEVIEEARTAIDIREVKHRAVRKATEQRFPPAIRVWASRV